MQSAKKRICVITGTRAEYGLLQPTLREIKNSDLLELQLIVTGMHLCTEYGRTIDQIKSDGFIISHEIDILLASDTPVAITKSVGLGTIGFADALKQLSPDLLLIVGDRYELLSAAIASMILRIPIAHCHGGEVTEGAIDESIRHAITKMSSIHFVASDTYHKRVLQLGEAPGSVHNVGGLGLDSINSDILLTRPALETTLGFCLRRKNILITYHPATTESESSSSIFQHILEALPSNDEYGFIFTMPNSDADSRIIKDLIKNYCSYKENAISFDSLGQQRYLSAIYHVDLVLGNSSSGLLEAPSLLTPTINIGSRQSGRLKADSVFDVQPIVDHIRDKINYVFSESYQQNIPSFINPYGQPGASKRIVNILENISLSDYTFKSFYDYP